MRWWIPFRALIVALTLAANASVVQAADMYAGASRIDPATAGFVYTIDDGTGLATLLGTGTTPRGLSGLAFDSTGRLFGATRPGASELVEIDPATGTVLSTAAIRIADGNPLGISDLAVQPGTDVIFAVTSLNNPCSFAGFDAFCIYTIDSAGLATLVGPLVDETGFIYDNGGIAFTQDGTLWLVENFLTPMLSRVNPANGTIVSTDSVPLLFAPGETDPVTGDPLGGRDAPMDGLGARPTDGQLFSTGPAGVQEVLTVGFDGSVRFFSGAVGAKITDIAFPPGVPDICPGGDDTLDADGDGVPDFCDVCPGGDDGLDADGDGVPDFCDTCALGDDTVDTDGDGVPNACDVCLAGDDTADSDLDGVPDACDLCAAGDDHVDGDSDGVPDACDICLAGDDGADADADGVPDACDVCSGADDALDADSDGVPDACDLCALGDDGFDADGDGVPDACDICVAGDDNVDSDLDGVPDACDPCPLDADNDADGDGVCGDVDVCTLGDDTIDSDMDGTADACDVCPLDPDNDADGDGVCGDIDNCALVSNSDQADQNGDGEGDACDADIDGDGIVNDMDNCVFDPNSDQSDVDGDGLGDLCDDAVDDLDGDGVFDSEDTCPGTPSGEVVDGLGCSIAQRCPCEHPVGGNKWKNHGAYVSCVAHSAGDFVELGLISEAEKDATVSAAGQSTCGHKNK